MRAIGYDAATAVADLIDNSITAGATTVDLRFPPGRPTCLAIVDNGRGMNAEDLLVAMRHGSRSPNEPRQAGDLGRFGLGLKTASMSQCRRLTVASRLHGSTAALQWDLDEVGFDWEIGVLEPHDIRQLPFIEELEILETGTMVLWEKLDVLAADETGDGSVFGARISTVREHLSLVFHRFLADGRQPFSISINRTPVIPIDPFLEHLGSTAGPEERISVEGHPVLLRAFTLPHISKLSVEQISSAGGEAGLRKRQGFYVYRDRRLIIWGTWFRLFRQEELTKLTRVRVDVSNTLDHLWRLDIKKSVASPPESIRNRLRGLVPTLVLPSTRTSRFRARMLDSKQVEPIWSRLQGRQGVFYAINMQHPLIQALQNSVSGDSLSDLNTALRAISESIPVDAIYHDGASDTALRSDPVSEEDIEEHLEDLARQIVGAFSDDNRKRDEVLKRLSQIEPFALHPAITQRLQERLVLP
jgi:hypothetical protein